jgi:serine protease Do
MKRWTLAIVCLMLGALLGSFTMPRLLQGQAPAIIAAPQQPPPREPNSYRDIVKKVLPAVVSIETGPGARVQLPPGIERPPFNPDGPRLTLGSGFFVDAKGVIVTNFHVIDGVDVVTVKLMDGRKFNSKNIRGDRKTDLAVILVDLKAGENVPVLELGDSEDMEIGDRVLAAGAPFGLTGSVTHGIVSAKGRSGLAMNMYEDFIQTDAAINPGNSGGPLVNLDGKVVGINAAIKSRTGGFSGVGLAVASNLARTVIKGLVADGVVHRGYLGIGMRDLALEDAAKVGLEKTGGVVVAEVYDNTPASKGGLQKDDIITAINERPIRDGRVLQTVVVSLPLNQPAEVAIVRGNQAMKLKITIEELPQEFGK